MTLALIDQTIHRTKTPFIGIKQHFVGKKYDFISLFAFLLIILFQLIH